MNSLIRKIFKTFFSIVATFFLFLIIISISLYIYIGKGLEFEINKSNSTVASLSKQYNIDFDPSSTINLVADTDRVDVYLLLKNITINKSDESFLKADNVSLRTSLSYVNIMLLGSNFFNTEKILYSSIGSINIHLNEPVLNIKNFNSSDNNDSSKSSQFFPLSIKADNGVLFDGDLEIGNFSMTLDMNQFENASDIQSYSIHLESHKDFPADYIGQFFEEVVLLQDKNETVYFDINIKDEEVATPENTQILNGILRVRDTKMDLERFPVELKPEPIRNLNLDLNIIDNIGQINFLGSVTNPKIKLKLQKKPNLQIAGSINFQEILEPYLDLTVNGTDIYFAKLENNNLNGITDLMVSISGKNVLDLAGELNIKKSNGFLVPLTNSTFETQHTIKKENDE
ncbi:MAG: hypothetical protein ABGW72_00760 [bacterium]|jgi:hypothetical protein|nr:hypothetical protein [Candidatus Neomarinimicrobiota bacterium]HIL86711.1 hypothetical protein [Candidatus Neomarinimicrobiota bacterium]